MSAVIKPTGKSLDAFNRGKQAAKNGAPESANPYLKWAHSMGGPQLSSWWSAGYIEVKRKHKDERSI